MSHRVSRLVKTTYWRICVAVAIIAALIGAVLGVNVQSSPSEALSFGDVVFPDGSVDICAWAFGGAKAEPAAIERALNQVLALDSLRDLKVGGLGKGVRECVGRPNDDMSSVVRPALAREDHSLRFAPVGGDAGLVDEKGRDDLWLFVVPQATADQVGTAWRDRRVAWQMVQRGDVYWELSGAILVGDEEVTDPAFVRRILAIGLGFQPVTDGRPFVDGVCVNADGANCGPEPGQ